MEINDLGIRWHTESTCVSNLRERVKKLESTLEKAYRIIKALKRLRGGGM